MPPRGGRGRSPTEGEGSTPKGTGGENPRGSRTDRRESRSGGQRWDDAQVDSLQTSRLSKGRGVSDMGTPHAAGGLAERSPYMTARNLIASGMDRLGLSSSQPGTPAVAGSQPATVAEEGGSGVPRPPEGLPGVGPLPSSAAPRTPAVAPGRTRIAAEEGGEGNPHPPGGPPWEGPPPAPAAPAGRWEPPGVMRDEMYDIQNTEVSRIWCIASYDLDNEQVHPWNSQNFEGGVADEIWVLWYWNEGAGGVALRNARHPQRCGVRVSIVPPSAVGNGGRMVTTHRASEF
jgi:hypothetical protein